LDNFGRGVEDHPFQAARSHIHDQDRCAIHNLRG
jgi:hypothetical protein